MLTTLNCGTTLLEIEYGDATPDEVINEYERNVPFLAPLLANDLVNRRVKAYEHNNKLFVTQLQSFKSEVKPILVRNIANYLARRSKGIRNVLVAGDTTCLVSLIVCIRINNKKKTMRIV